MALGDDKDLTYLLPFSSLSLYVSFSSASSVSRAHMSSKE